VKKMPRKKIPEKIIKAAYAANAFKPSVSIESERKAGRKGPSKIMYIECKAGHLTGAARMGRVTFSKTWKTVYYQGKTLQRLPQGGFKANYYDKETGEDYWISGSKRDGGDRLYGERVPILIDDDVREEYWCQIRNLPELKNHSKV
jgi:hypothetical protein